MTDGWDERRARQERNAREWAKTRRGCRLQLNILLMLFALAAIGLWAITFAIP